MTESTFADRLGRATTMANTVQGFSPAFTPADADLEPANFLTYIGTCTTKHQTVLDLLQQYATTAGQRITLTTDVKDRCRRSKDFVISDKSLKSYFSTVKRTAAKITSHRTSKPAPPPAGGEPAKKRNTGEQSYADIANNYKSLIGIYTSMGASYAPTATDLSLANLNTTQTQLVTYNTDLGTLLGQLRVNQGERLTLFDGEDGLREKMKAIKAAVKSQYGADSPEYNSVKGIRV